MKKDQPQKLICEERDFAKTLEDAGVMGTHILDCLDDDQLEDATVSVTADFLLTVMDMLLEYAGRYENFDVSEIVEMYEYQKFRQSRLGCQTVH